MSNIVHMQTSLQSQYLHSFKLWFLMYLQCYKWTLDGLHHENVRQPSEQNLHTWIKNNKRDWDFSMSCFHDKKLQRQEHFHQGMHFGVRWSQYLGRKRKITICVENANENSTLYSCKCRQPPEWLSMHPWLLQQAYNKHHTVIRKYDTNSIYNKKGHS